MLKFKADDSTNDHAGETWPHPIPLGNDGHFPSTARAIDTRY
jgi:hypothetical protein